MITAKRDVRRLEGRFGWCSSRNQSPSSTSDVDLPGKTVMPKKYSPTPMLVSGCPVMGKAGGGILRLLRCPSDGPLSDHALVDLTRGPSNSLVRWYLAGPRWRVAQNRSISSVDSRKEELVLKPASTGPGSISFVTDRISVSRNYAVRHSSVIIVLKRKSVRRDKSRLRRRFICRTYPALSERDKA